MNDRDNAENKCRKWIYLALLLGTYIAQSLLNCQHTRRVEKLLLAPANDGWREMVGAGVEGAHPMPIVSLKSLGPPRRPKGVSIYRVTVLPSWEVNGGAVQEKSDNGSCAELGKTNDSHDTRSFFGLREKLTA